MTLSGKATRATFRMKLTQIDHVTGCARVLSAFLNIQDDPTLVGSLLVPYCVRPISPLWGAACCYFTHQRPLSNEAPLGCFGQSFRQNPGSETLLKRQCLVPGSANRFIAAIVKIDGTLSRRLQ